MLKDNQESLRPINEEVEEDSPRVTPQPVNNILLDETPAQMTDGLDAHSSPKAHHPKASAVYESVSVDIKCQSISDAFSAAQPSSEVMGTQVHPEEAAPGDDESQAISNGEVDDLF